MTNISSVPEVQAVSKPKVSLDDRIAEVRRAVRHLDSAIDDLVWALERLDDEDFPASVRELAADMSIAAEGVHDFECGDFSDQADELETLAEEEDEDDEEDQDDAEVAP